MVCKAGALSAGETRKDLCSGRARYVPERTSYLRQSRSLRVSAPGDPQVNQSAGDAATAPQTSQGDNTS